MQTDLLSGTRSSWSQWAFFLRQRRLGMLACWLLEALGPLTVIGAQLLHAGTPLLRPAFSSLQMESLATLLEDPAESRAFADFLREEAVP